ncbi:MULTISPECIES: ParB/RepB/Spo0J family partition protein [Rickettsieae]|uniref:ParB/RepB/Spo0J family partition protein n=1 Tax=Rickettsieae TaxID=33988 RepID=UPI001DE579BA|nr:ParB/RepB/Spo0J family partition protein [Rickettsia endosymbiont of Oedothorax gibbosus]MCC8399600.1 ParB/RepB/Spo0J family partition protein [Rickettsia endosymbiont of Platyusa sonomae]HJD63593.1 ParB/RepB/Spo0J family partition protein [Rickettsia endosymbiont of Sericostoma sp.]
MKNKNLGKGLSALLGEEVFTVEKDELVKIIDIDKIEARNNQPRKKFEYDKIKELADSISNNGLLQPIIVSSVSDGKYKIIAGERRWRACKVAKLTDIPAIIKDIGDKEIIEIALIENIQREELSVIEESEGFERLIKEFGYTQEQLAEKVSKSRSHIANLLRLNQLPQSIKDKINEGLLTMGHARCLINHQQAEVIANHIIENDLSVRQTEDIVRNWSKNEYTKTPEHDKRIGRGLLKESSKENDLQLLAKSLSERFNIKVTIEDYPIGGKLIFHYSNLEELDSILSRLN